MVTKIYTKVAKLYSIAYLGLVALSCAVNAIIWIMIFKNNAAGNEISFTSIFFVTITALVVVAAIVGIFQEKMWAKWITLGIYSWYIFGNIHSIIQTSLLGSLGIDSKGLKVMNLIALIFPVLGIIFLLEKPKTNVSS
ncbi:hypothetical protein A4S05_33205 [Nostoc sp. KVJ20]|uniref:hypothetical protein n=1 Tax=unclassified Nostoc TaxID=2593658 RepID=UPI00083E36F5|nr:hypothetical protein [Nostoc sp. KVJ20]ODH00448.1 hypothetical protein A4S05_33205 [Nostoc sp. KVJ20]